LKINDRTQFAESLYNLAEGRRAEALDKLINIVMNQSELIELYVVIGSLFRRENDLLKAVQLHESVLNRPNVDRNTQVTVYKELYRDFKKAGNTEKALEYLEKYLGAKSDNSALIELAHLQRAMGRYEAAIKFYKKHQKAMGTDNSIFIAQCMLDMADDAQGQPFEMKQLKNAVKTAPGSPLVRFRYIEALEKETKKSKYYDELRAIVREDMVSSKTEMKYLESAFFGLGQINELIEMVMRKVTSGSDNPFFTIFSSEQFEKKGDMEKSIKILEDYVSEFGAVYHVIERYAELKNDEVMKKLLQKLTPYRCTGCGHTPFDHYHVCPSCGCPDCITYL